MLLLPIVPRYNTTRVQKILLELLFCETSKSIMEQKEVAVDVLCDHIDGGGLILVPLRDGCNCMKENAVFSLVGKQTDKERILWAHIKNSEV